jgi:beta-phosphoglucomutase-like phosphatase (HAD superfamily)
MCEKCDEIDKKIERYRVMASRITDQPILNGIRDLIEQMRAQKAALHPEQ